ncbi:hypothetical protein AX16_000367 [Volvariella volvacea WC 439]|nr:hypothetical protein AX16_000367 [Volvariella volvacea WC 439]
MNSKNDGFGADWYTVIPLVPIGLAFVLDVSSALPKPNRVKAISRAISAPFQNFLKLGDLADPIDDPRPPPLFLARSLKALAFVQLTIGLTLLIEQVVTKDSSLKSLGIFLGWAYTLFTVVRSPPATPPYLLIAFATCHAVVIIIGIGLVLISGVVARLPVLDLVSLGLATAFVAVAGCLPMTALRPAKNVAQSWDAPSSFLSSPEDDVTLWSWCSFKFVEPIFGVARKGTINDEDVWSLSPFFLHKNLFQKCLEYRELHPEHSLLRFLVVSNSLDLILDASLEMWSTFIGFVPPYALQEILAALSENTPSARERAYYWAFITFIAHLSFAQKDLFKGWHTRRCYERTRGQLFCALHYKSLKRQDLSEAVKREGEEATNADLGKVVNLMQGDTYAVAQRFWEFSSLIANPIRLVIALVFLYQVLGWSAFAGVAVILVASILNYPLSTYNIKITRYSWGAKDKRMGIVNELLQNIRFLKFYGWEYHWSRIAERAREVELRWRVKENINSTLISFIWIWIPSATALASFMCFTLVAGEKLTVSKAFTSIALFSHLQGPMTSLPGQVMAMLHAYVSMQRIEGFLSEPEVESWASSLTTNNNGLYRPGLGFRDAVFQWNTGTNASSTPSRFELGPLNIEFPEGCLTIIGGATGSGKSALLSALLGEMHRLRGEVFINKADHSVAFCAQNSWLEHATIRDNIIFGSNFGFDEERYRQVLYACALEKDLDVLDAGDVTEIGEKGITLSGGQRARIALARAVYSQAKYLLLDDPLAAVDMHTAQHIVTRCFQGDMMRGRTVILVTHHVQLCLPAARRLIEIENGQVVKDIDSSEFSREDMKHFAEMKTLSTEFEIQDDNTTAAVGNEADDSAAASVNSQRKVKGNGKLVEAEARAEGRVSLKTYLIYIKAAGILSWMLTIALMLFIRLINISNQVFVARWGEAYEQRLGILRTMTLVPIKYPWDGLPSPNIDVKPWLMIYLLISLTGAFTVLFYIALGYYASLQASRVLFLKLLHRLTRAPTRFFDTTPIGRILNRFTTDINVIDGALQNSARNCISGILDFIASFIVILVVVPSFAPFALFIAWLYIRLAPPYIMASRDLRRLESISLSPAFAGFDELLRGIVHIRAFGMEQRYQEQFYKKVDKFQSFDHVYWLVNGWLRWRYDCLGSVVVFAATIFALWRGVADGSAAIVIVQAGIFAEASRQLVKVAAQLELDFNSVERVSEYLDVPQEAPPVIKESRPPAYWPSSSGQIVVEDLTVQYAPHLAPVLHGLSFTIRQSEKIGIVGRTGSGKSTLALSLLRMVEPSGGRIFIDNLDISTIGLEDLRTRITIISQDVALFSGTIRSNLDPLGQHTDRECWDVLERCHLIPLLKHTPSEREPTILDMPVSQNSLSAGEKQLMALARAVLRRTNVVIMDEATSQIDVLLDDRIQETIREELSSAIVITIAHRLKTVINYDRILVLDDGNIVEFGPPKELLTRVNGPFQEMCRKSADWRYFKSIAGEANST